MANRDRAAKGGKSLLAIVAAPALAMTQLDLHCYEMTVVSSMYEFYALAAWEDQYGLFGISGARCTGGLAGEKWMLRYQQELAKYGFQSVVVEEASKAGNKIGGVAE